MLSVEEKTVAVDRLILRFRLVLDLATIAVVSEPEEAAQHLLMAFAADGAELRRLARVRA